MAIRLSGMSSGLDTEALVTELVSAYKKKGDTYKKEQTKLSWTQDAWKSLNTKIYSFYKKASDMRFTNSYTTKKTTVSDTTKATVTASNSSMNGTQTLSINKLAKNAYLTGGEISGSGSTKLSELGVVAGKTGKIKIKGSGGEKELDITDEMTVDAFVKQVNDSGAGVKASFDSANHRLFLTSLKSGEENNFTITGEDVGGKAVLSVLQLDGESAHKEAATDAEIVLNGATFKSATNSFDINGLSIKAQAKTTSELTVTTATDTDGIYNKIKDFISDYNSLIKEMSTLYNASSAKGYEPLTSDEKYAMSDKEVEEWEAKIKGSLLRRDSTLGSLINVMTNGMSSSVEIGDKKYGLAALGIKTGSYFTTTAQERGMLHIDGDSDDDTSSGNTDKLKAMLENDPDKAIEIFKGITSKVYTDLDKRMKSTSMRSAYTVYNDKEMSKNYSDYTKKIRNWDDKVAEIEDSYYKKFAAMETAMAKLQSQSSQMSGFFR